MAEKESPANEAGGLPWSLTLPDPETGEPVYYHRAPDSDLNKPVGMIIPVSPINPRVIVVERAGDDPADAGRAVTEEPIERIGLWDPVRADMISLVPEKDGA